MSEVVAQGNLDAVLKRRQSVSLEEHIEELYALVGDRYQNQSLISNLILAASVQLLTCTVDESQVK